ncbi:Zn-ribbon domain-containing OB-fold protein [Actinomycetospora straminea]|uniref:Zn-ribbon domain-containing OB-fold protein n=1 Tax=Actinomycetospora straminea TaxID=663607 RepID=A0ABP9EHP0_9PSEU|nr:OB-fold domain-containing protein [Actinomycetospora straminea]MDD7933798.1 OB-fold domain-containing protein [Actinomycetospora straminea]
MTARPRPAPPEPDADSATFWAALREERIALQRCSACQRLRFPPMGRCPWCATSGGAAEDVPGTGSVYSWIVVHRAFDEAFAADVPYVVATVDLDEGPRLALRLDEPDGVDFGARVRPRFHHHEDWSELRMVLDG